MQVIQMMSSNVAKWSHQMLHCCIATTVVLSTRASNLWRSRPSRRNFSPINVLVQGTFGRCFNELNMKLMGIYFEALSETSLLPVAHTGTCWNVSYVFFWFQVVEPESTWTDESALIVEWATFGMNPSTRRPPAWAAQVQKHFCYVLL